MNSNQEWMNKLESEQSLSMAESHDLDQKLEAQRPIARTIWSLEDPEPSLAWRSELNEKLFALQAPVAKPSWFRRWGLASMGSAVAVTTSVLFVLHSKQAVVDLPSAPVASTTSAEQVLIDAHQGAVFALSTGAGDGSEPVQTGSTTPVHTWTEAELEAF